MEKLKNRSGRAWNRLIHGDEYNPHSVLGLHAYDFEAQEPQEAKKIYLFRPGATEIHLEVFGETVQARGLHESGLFEYEVPTETTAADYRIYHANGLLAHDPYAFMPTIGEYECYLYGKGVHYELYRVLGAHFITQWGIKGVRFAVWAPGAIRVSLIGDFNYWDSRTNPMRSLGSSGIWEIFIPGLNEGIKYKFEIKTQSNQLQIKADPFAFSSELRPATASIVTNLDKFEWEDQDWLRQRRE